MSPGFLIGGFEIRCVRGFSLGGFEKSLWTDDGVWGGRGNQSRGKYLKVGVESDCFSCFSSIYFHLLHLESEGENKNERFETLGR